MKFLILFSFAIAVQAQPFMTPPFRNPVVSSSSPTNIVPNYFWFIGTNSSGTTVTDASGNGNNGTANSVVLTANGMIFKVASSAYISSIGSISQPTNFTCIAWILATNSSSQVLDVFSGNGGQSYSFSVSGNASPSTLCFTNRGGGKSYGASTGTVPVGTATWVQVGLTFDASFNYVFYTNGVNAGSGNCSATWAAPGGRVMEVGGVNNYFNGQMFGVRGYTNALTSGQMLDLYQWSNANGMK
jgi:hypothetical protein